MDDPRHNFLLGRTYTATTTATYLDHHNHQHHLNPNSGRAKYADQKKQKQQQPLDPSIVETTVQQMRLPQPLETVDASTLDYDIHKCPPDIPPGYPIQWNVMDVLKNWNPDDMEISSTIYQGLCTVDWRDPVQQQTADTYRQAEVPFMIHHHPEVWQAAERWSHYDYVEKLLKDEAYRNEHSKNNHMPYWKLRRGKQGPPGWEPPTENVELTFQEWYQKANELETTHSNKNNNINITQVEHWYFRLNGEFKGKSGFLYDELPLFVPKKSFFMVDPKDQRGINCRLGSKSIIADLHYDMSRNFILLLKGQKRYILAHPDQCLNLELHPPGHPSARHSRVDWSDPKDWHTGNFEKARVNEVLMQAGDILYLPTSWFHYIVSLNLNYQCNARSGTSYENLPAIQECGF
jgi:hypothetical protein